MGAGCSNHGSVKAWMLVVVGGLLSLQSFAATSLVGQARVAPQAIQDKATRNEPVEVLILLDDAENQAAEAMSGHGKTPLHKATPTDYGQRMRDRETRLVALKAKFRNDLTDPDIESLKDYSVLPVMQVRIKSQRALEKLLSHTKVLSVDENKSFTPTLTQSLPLVGQPTVFSSGHTGEGTTVAVLDTGVDYTRTAFGSCSSPSGECKVSVAMDFAINDGFPDDPASMHGTNVAGIVLGVAPLAKIAALDVFEGGLAWSDDIISAINWCIANRVTYNIASINMSLGGISSPSPKPATDSWGIAITSAINSGIVVVAASGNNGYKNAISLPAAYEGVVSVGAVYDSSFGGSLTWGGGTCTDNAPSEDQVTCFSNSASFLTMLAPGAMIDAAGINMGGTSQATPHVSGAAALLRQTYPDETVSQLVGRLVQGPSVTDSANGIAKPRLSLPTISVINGQCGPVHATVALTPPPSSNLCSAGIPSSITSTPSNYEWSCISPNGGSNVSCYALRDYTPPTISLGEAVDNSDLAWTSGEGANWFGQTATSYSGADAAQSGAILDSQESWLQTSVTGPGTFTYQWRVSSELNWDYLSLYLDDMLLSSISGELDWQSQLVSIQSGAHTLRWIYSKDGSVSEGSDAGWVDLVAFTPNETNASCGSTVGGVFTTPPTTDLCAAGLPSIVVESPTEYSWDCVDQGSGSAVYCAARRGFTVTAYANGGNGIVTPPSQMIAYGGSGMVNAMPNVGYLLSFTGTCSGMQNGNSFITEPVNADCVVIANFNPIPTTVDGQCGSAHAVPTPNAPTTNLCVAGTPSAVTGTGPWSWTCAGSNGGNPANCSAPVSSGGILSFTTTGTTVSEAGPNQTLAVRRTGAFSGSVSITWTTANGTALAGSDYTARTGTLTWANGDSANKIIAVGPTVVAGNHIPVTNDTLYDPAEIFTVSLSNPTNGAGLGTDGLSTVTIADNETQIEFALTDLSLPEPAGTSSGTATLQLTRSGNTAVTSSVSWNASNLTATAGSDYGTKGSTALPSGSVSFTSGQTTKQITIPLHGDTLAEGNETFRVSLGTVSGAVLGAQRIATVTLLDDDKGFKFVSTTVSANESNPANLTVSRIGATSGAASVNYTVAGGTATSGVDYTPASGTLSWNDGEGGDKPLSVATLEDTLVEPNETISVTLSAPSAGAQLVGGNPATVTILDNDSNLQFSAATASVLENQASLTLTVTRAGQTGGNATVSWAAANGSASAGSDYGSNGNPSPPGGSLTFTAGITSRTFSIPILPDTLYEGNETFTVTLSNPSGATLGLNPTITVTLRDDEAGVQFDQAAYVVAEGTASAALRINRVGPTPTATQSVRWTAVNGEAVAGQDYGSNGSAAAPTGTVSWAAGDTATFKTISIPILNDSTPEGDESFTINLSNYVGGLAAGSPASTTVTIWDNDSPLESTIALAQTKYVVEEDAGQVQLQVTRSGDVHRPASVNWAASNGGATAGQDYGTPGSVTLPAGTLNWAAHDSGAKTISIPILDDTSAETMEHFKVTLSGNSVSTGLGDIQQATVVIRDIDEVFPSQAEMPDGWVKPEQAATGWHVAEDAGAAEGKHVLRTNIAFHHEQAQVALTGDFQAGTVSFRLKVSSEESFDVLRFYIDGVQWGEWSGNLAANWTIPPGISLEAGVHTLLWSYEKDADIDLGQDAAWIDQVVLPDWAGVDP